MRSLEPGRAAFNRGAFFEAHELWEDVWRDLTGSDRTFVQGLIRIAAGLHHLQGGRTNPAARLLAKGAEKISRAAPAGGDVSGIQVDALLREVARLLARLKSPGVQAPDTRALKL